MDTILSCIGDGVIATDSKGIITYINHSAENLTGWMAKCAKGKEFSQVLPLVNSDTLESLQSPVQFVLQSGTAIGLQNNSAIISRDGVAKFISANCSPITDGDLVTGVVVVFRDITHLKRMEDELHIANHYLNNILDSFPALIWRNDANNECEYVNKAWCEFTGDSIEEALTQNWFRHIHPEDLDRCIDNYNSYVEKRIPYQIEYRLKKYDGEYRWVIDTGKPFYNENGDFHGYIGVIQDITDRKEHEDLLKQAKVEAEHEREVSEAANKAKSEFLANMSHEIRTPINGIVGMIELTLLTELNKEQKENLITAKGCAGSLLRIINDILDFSKMEAGKLSIEKVDFNIKKLLDDITKSHSVRANEKGLELLYAFSTNIPPYLVGDSSRLQQVVNNLLSNAIKFTENGDVSVEVRKKTSFNDYIELQFSVKDSGIGISPENTEKLFKSFSQVDGSFTRKYGGTGLGLAISKQLVEIMGGKIWVDSERGRGSTFYFTLPFKIGNKPEKDVFKPLEYEPVRNLYILMVEDDQVNQLILTRMLDDKGFKVDIACNGIEALTALQKNQYDLILMDIQMPGMDGVEATEKIREREKKENCPFTPIIALTAYALQGDRDRFLALGMDDYISKPINMRELFATIDKVMSNRERDTSSETDVRITDDGKLVHNGLGKLSLEREENLLHQIEKKIGEFVKIIDGSDLTMIESLANQIKNLFNRMGADELKSTAFRIELSARRGDIQETVEHILQIQREFATFNKSYIKGENSI
jgi:PAS domain S-box